ncbi:hypothetical protein GGX14DRAFT_406317 [Mycena pura]|uniref:Uncharacterized protein n=1 Tax=Mycena pura TaxID=153505 RepID=A0AAD6UQW2_9AGAR|nr:hypothetical protein GGX14DRAFT_406317 [Mycena pura]
MCWVQAGSAEIVQNRQSALVWSGKIKVYMLDASAKVRVGDRRLRRYRYSNTVDKSPLWTKVLLFTLLRAFEFALAVLAADIRVGDKGTAIAAGNQLPLLVKPVGDSEWVGHARVKSTRSLWPDPRDAADAGATYGADGPCFNLQDNPRLLCHGTSRRSRAERAERRAGAGGACKRFRRDGKAGHRQDRHTVYDGVRDGERCVHLATINLASIN